MAYTPTNYNTFTRARLQNISVDDSVLLQFLNDANRDVSQPEGVILPFMRDIFIGTLTQGEIEYDLPDNCQTPLDLVLTDPDGSAKYLEFMEYEEYRKKYPDPTAGTEDMPLVWTRFGSTFIVGPTPPDQAYTLEMPYIKNPTTVTAESTSIDVPDTWSEIVTLGMVYRVLKMRRRYDQAQVVAQDADLLNQKMISRLVSSQLGVPTHVRSGWGGR